MGRMGKGIKERGEKGERVKEGGERGAEWEEGQTRERIDNVKKRESEIIF